MKTTFLSLALLSLTSALSAQDLQTSAYRNSIAQDEVRKQAEQARVQLQLLMEDFQQNQLASPEFVQVQETFAKLATLSDAEIIPLVQALKEVASLQQVSEAEGKLNSASQTQKNIGLSLKTLADHLALQMNQSSMERRLQQLVLAQTGNLRQTKELAVSGKTGTKLPKELQPIYTLSQNEQASIKQETDLMLATLEKVVAALPPAERGGFAGALEEAKKLGLGATAVKATEDLAAGRFTEAMGSEGRVLDGLQVMLVKIKEGQSVQERVAAMAEKLQQLASAQKQLAQTTEKSDPAAQKDLREEQKKLTNEVAALKKELTGLNASASNQADQAEKAMESAESKLADKESLKDDAKKDTSKAQSDAAAKLQAAGDAMQAQADKMAAAQAAQAPQTPAEALQDLAKLNEQVKDAMAQQSALDAAPTTAAADAQKKLAEDTAKLQEQALTKSPEAAQSLGQAAAQMAQNSPSPQTPPGASPQSPAAQALAEASAQIQQQMDMVQQAVNQQAALQAMAAPIQAAKQQTQEAAKGMGPENKDLSTPTKQMMEAQQTLAGAEGQTKAPGAPEGVGEAVKDAQKELEKSVLEAAQSKGKEAGEANKKAEAAMDKALGAIDKAMAAAAAEAAAAAPAMAGAPAPGAPGAPGAPAPGAPGAPGAPAPGMPGMPMPGQMGMAMDGMSGGGQDTGGQNFLGNSGPAGGNGQVVTGIKPKDRAAVSLLQKEKAPAEYNSMVQQYLKNLAEGAAPGRAGQ